MSETDVDRHIVGLYSMDASERTKAHSALRAMGELAIPRLLTVVSGKYPTPDFALFKSSSLYWDLLYGWEQIFHPDLLVKRARRQAAGILGEIKDPQTFEPLMSLYWKIHDEEIRTSIVFALSKFKDPRAIETLGDALKIRSSQTFKIVRALGEMRDSRAIPYIVPLIYKGDIRSGMAEECLEALFDIGTPEAAQAMVDWVRQAIRLPSENWVDHQKNVGDNDWGGQYHVTRDNFGTVINYLEEIGDPKSLEALDRELAAAPSYIPRRPRGYQRRRSR